MNEAFLANTSTQGLSPLGTAPQRSFELISGTVRDHLEDRHAAIFAEPVATQYGDRFDWYAVVAGKPRRLESFEEEEQAQIKAELDGLIGDINTLAQSFLNKADPDEQRLGEALSNAARYPDAESVYVLVDGDQRQPVLLNWAWVSDNQAAVIGDLSGSEGAARASKAATAKAAAATAASVTAAAAPVPPPPIQRAEKPRRPLGLGWLLWLGWLLLLLLLAAILYLMIESCALRLPGVPNYCPPPGPEASEEERRTLWLRDQIATVERQIGIADRACQPERQASIVPDAPDADASRLAERGAREGELTISLIWDSVADLHMDVRCPGNQIINYDNPSSCGGTLDVGGNHNIATSVQNAIESMYFDAPQSGPYAVSVSLYNPHGQSAIQSFRLRIRDGENTETMQGTVVRGQQAWTTTYIVGKNK